eukprot:TRINITY_DN8027_c0_g1_i2.p1 TRINITY_DN8027_c0_g1~~TRINITY_DN8027_c0_g1_i2.p1  ORF type:complete len:203 (+),score=-8.03 TRINITY_DN8027_c0_g1_i2:496-1104(+)
MIMIPKKRQIFPIVYARYDTQYCYQNQFKNMYQKNKPTILDIVEFGYNELGYNKVSDITNLFFGLKIFLQQMPDIQKQLIYNEAVQTNQLMSHQQQYNINHSFFTVGPKIYNPKHTQKFYFQKWQSYFSTKYIQSRKIFFMKSELNKQIFTQNFTISIKNLIYNKAKFPHQQLSYIQTLLQYQEIAIITFMYEHLSKQFSLE